MSGRNKNPKYFSDVEYPHTNGWNKTHDLVHFRVSGIHLSVANSLRRAITSEVPTVGFICEPYKYSTIKVTKNTTNVNDQMIAKQLSLVPINVVHPDKFNVDDYEFIIDENNSTNSIKYVTTEHIKIKRISTNTFLNMTDLRSLIPPDPLTGNFIPIVTLMPKYRTLVHQNDPAMENAIGEAIQVSVRDVITIQITAKCIVSNGRGEGISHFSPATTATYGYTIDSEAAKLAENEYIEETRQKAMSAGLTPMSEEKLHNRFNINMVQRIYIKDEYGDPISFNFRVESIGIIPPLVIVERAAQALVSMVEEFISNLRVGASDAIDIVPITTRGANGFNIKIINRDDTLGNLLMSWLSRQFSDYALPAEERQLEFVGYHRTHPMLNHVNIEIRPIGSQSIEECIKDIIIPGCSGLVKHLMNIVSDIRELPEYLREAKQIA